MSDGGSRSDATREDAVAALNKLASMANSHVTGVMLVAQNDDDIEVSQLRPTDRALPSLTGVVTSAAENLANSEVIDYEPATSTNDEQVMWINVDAVPLLRAIADESADLANMPVFVPAEGALRELRLAAMRAENDDGPAVFVQSLRGNQIVARSRRVGFIVRRGVIDAPPASAEILLFNKEVSAVVVGRIALFRDRPAFQRLFGLLEEIRQQAAATFESVTTDLRIEGLDRMAAAVTGSPAMLGKMASIQRKLDRYPKYRDALTMPRLVAFVDKHPELGVEIAGEGDAARFVFHTDPQRRFKILKLLDDDYLRSELTTLEYEASSKSSPLGTG